MATEEGAGEDKMVKGEEAPPFHLTERDKWLLSITDEEFTPHTWEDLKEIIATNRLDHLLRRPSDLKRYLAWTQSTKAQYGTMTNYLIQHRLPWGHPPFTSQSTIPFTNPADYTVLVNDWPYGFEEGIRHLVVWSKTPIATDDTGDLTEESIKCIAGFVERVFVSRVGKEKVLWFKNWTGLQSVRALEHIHVLVRAVGDEDLMVWTGNHHP